MSFFRITILKVDQYSKRNFFWSTTSLCFYVYVYPCCLKVWIKIESESRLHCIGICDNDCIKNGGGVQFNFKFYWPRMRFYAQLLLQYPLQEQPIVQHISATVPDPDKYWRFKNVLRTRIQKLVFEECATDPDPALWV